MKKNNLVINFLSTWRQLKNDGAEKVITSRGVLRPCQRRIVHLLLLVLRYRIVFHCQRQIVFYPFLYRQYQIVCHLLYCQHQIFCPFLYRHLRHQIFSPLCYRSKIKQRHCSLIQCPRHTICQTLMKQYQWENQQF